MPQWRLEHFGALEHFSIFGAFEHFGALEHWSAFGARALEHFWSVGSLDRFGSVGVLERWSIFGAFEHFGALERWSVGGLLEPFVEHFWRVHGEVDSRVESNPSWPPLRRVEYYCSPRF